MLGYLEFILNKQDSCPQRFIRSEVDTLNLSSKWSHPPNQFVKPNSNLMFKVVSALTFDYTFPFLQKVFLVPWNSYLKATCPGPWLRSSVPVSISSFPCLTSHGIAPPFLSFTESEQPHPSHLPWSQLVHHMLRYWHTTNSSATTIVIMCVIINNREINMVICV